MPSNLEQSKKINAGENAQKHTKSHLRCFGKKQNMLSFCRCFGHFWGKKEDFRSKNEEKRRKSEGKTKQKRRKKKAKRRKTKKNEGKTKKNEGKRRKTKENEGKRRKTKKNEGKRRKTKENEVFEAFTLILHLLAGARLAQSPYGHRAEPHGGCCHALTWLCSGRVKMYNPHCPKNICATSGIRTLYPSKLWLRQLVS